MKEDRLHMRSWSILLAVTCSFCLILHVSTMASPRWLVTSEGHAGLWVFCPSTLVINDTVVLVTGNDNIPCSGLRQSISIIIVLFYLASVLLTIATMALVIRTIAVASLREEHRLRYGFIIQCLSTILLVIVLIMKAVAPLEYHAGPAALGWPFFLTVIITLINAFLCILLILQIRRLRRGPMYYATGTADTAEDMVGVLRTPSVRARLNIEVVTKEQMEASRAP